MTFGCNGPKGLLGDIINCQNRRVGRNILRKRFNSVPDLIQHISWKKGRPKQDTTKNITSNSQVNSNFQTGGHWLVEH